MFVRGILKSMKDWVRYIQVQGKIKNFDSFQKAILNSMLINSDIIDNKVYARFKPFIKLSLAIK